MDEPNQHEFEHRVRVRAYEIWEFEARPEGRAVEHWHVARTEIEAENVDSAIAPAIRGDEASAFSCYRSRGESRLTFRADQGLAARTSDERRARSA